MKLERIPDEFVPADLAAWYTDVFTRAGAGKYQAIAYRFPHEQERMQATLDLLQYAPHRTCLEIGCNEGYMTRKLAGIFRHVEAWDFNWFAIAECPTLDNVFYRVRDGVTEEIESDFDAIVLSNILEHVRDPNALINKCLHRCKYLVAACPTSEPLNAERAFDASLIGKETRIGDASGHIWAMDEQGFLSWFEPYDVQQVKKVSHGMAVLVRGFV